MGEAKDTNILPLTNHALHHDHAYWGAAWFVSTSQRWLESQRLSDGETIQYTPQDLVVYSKALSAVWRALADPSVATHESTISSVMHIAFIPRMSIVDKKMARPKQSNFKNWNLLGLATGMQIADDHMHGLDTLVRMIGGIQNIKSAQIRRAVGL